MTYNKLEVIKEFRVSEKDTGSSAVQIIDLTGRISELAEHFQKHKKDNHSKVGFIKLIERRRKLMKYLKRNDLKTYSALIQKLGLRG